jgi:hypothetical protein
MVSTTCYWQAWFIILTVEQVNKDAPVFELIGKQHDLVSVPSPFTAISVGISNTVAPTRAFEGYRDLE